MFQYFYFFIGKRFLFGKTTDNFNKFISFLSTIGITLGVSSLIIVTSIMNGFEKNFEKNIINFIPHIMISDENNLIKNKDYIKNIFNDIEIISINSVIMEDVILQGYKNIAVATMFGLNNKEYNPIEKYFIKVKKKDLLSNDSYIIIGESLAKYLHVKKNDLINLFFPSDINSIYNNKIQKKYLFKVIGTFSTNNAIDNYQIFINQKSFFKIMKYPDPYITYWRIYLKKPLEIKNLSKLKNNIEKKKLIWKDWTDSRGDLFQAIKIEKNIMVILTSLTILISIFNLLTLILLLIIDKKKEISIIKTQGATNKQIMMIFISQSFLSGIIGIFLGNLISIIIIKNIKYFTFLLNKIFNLYEVPTTISYMQIFFLDIITIFLILLFTIYPSFYATKYKPAKILSYE